MEIGFSGIEDPYIIDVYDATFEKLGTLDANNDGNKELLILFDTHGNGGQGTNDSYLREVEKRYPDLKGILHCINIDLISEYEKLPESQLLIANLLIEYIGYEAFNRVVIQTRAKYVSCVIQINSSEKEWVSDSPYIHVFDGLDRIYCRMEEIKLSEAMNSIGYQKILQTSDLLPNGKSLVRLDYQRTE